MSDTTRLFEIIEGIVKNEGALTASESMTLDILQYDLEDWFKEHDRKVSETAWDEGVTQGVRAHCEKGCPVEYDKGFNPYRKEKS